MALKAVLFDLDDTLLWDERCVEEAFAAVCAEAEIACGVDAGQLEAAVRREAKQLYESFETYPFTQNIGINPFEGLWGRFNDDVHPGFAKLKEIVPYYRAESWTRGLRSLGIENPDLGRKLGERFPQERRKRSIVYEETYEVLSSLKGKFQLLLLTNGSPELQSEKLAMEPDLAGYFDHILISGNFGQGKPAPLIFNKALELAGIGPEEGIMIGDKLTTDVKGAAGVGIRTVWVNRKGSERSGGIIPDYEIGNLRELEEIIQSLM
jgi:putative hydrolase of the HAD superfamily